MVALKFGNDPHRMKKERDLGFRRILLSALTSELEKIGEKKKEVEREYLVCGKFRAIKCWKSNEGKEAERDLPYKSLHIWCICVTYTIIKALQKY